MADLVPSERALNHEPEAALHDRARAPKERPILFSGAMVRAVLAGTKTQTRRVVKPQPLGDKPRSAWFEPGVMGWAPPEIPSQAWHRVRCPYGQPGDRLWVREAFSGPHCMDATDECVAVQPSKWGEGSRIWYWADGNPTHGDWTRPRPSIHMPRWASRITLEITGVRVERLKDISDADAIAEGIEAVGDRWRIYGPESDGNDMDRSPRTSYCSLWESINGPGSWQANPWVWVLSFRQTAPVAQPKHSGLMNKDHPMNLSRRKRQRMDRREPWKEREQ